MIDVVIVVIENGLATDAVHVLRGTEVRGLLVAKEM